MQLSCVCVMLLEQVCLSAEKVLPVLCPTNITPLGLLALGECSFLIEHFTQD